MASSILQRKTVFSSIPSCFYLFLLLGNAVSVPCWCARQKSLAGHLLHFGSPFGTQTIAPSSISPWLKSLAASTGMTVSKSSSIRFLTDAFKMSSPSACESLLSTLGGHFRPPQAWDAKGDRTDGSRRVASNPGQGKNLVVIRRHLASIKLHDLTRRLLHVSYPGCGSQVLPAQL